MKYQVIVEYGQKGSDGRYPRVGTVRLPEGTTAATADEVAHDLHSLLSRFQSQHGWPFGHLTGVETVE